MIEEWIRNTGKLTNKDFQGQEISPVDICVKNELFSQGWGTRYEEKGNELESALRWKYRVVQESKRRLLWVK